MPVPAQVESVRRPRLALEHLYPVGPEPGGRQRPLEGQDVGPGREVAGHRVGSWYTYPAACGSGLT